MGVAEGRPWPGGGGSGKLHQFLPGRFGRNVTVNLHPPDQRSAVGESRVLELLHRRANIPFVPAQGLVIAPHRQLEQRLVPGQVHPVGGAAVVIFQPATQERSALVVLAHLVVHVGHGVSGHAVGRVDVQRALGQVHSLVHLAHFVIGPSVLPHEGPVFSVVGRGLAHQPVEPGRIVRGTDADTALRVEPLGQTHQQGVERELLEMFMHGRGGVVVLSIDEFGHHVNVAPFSPAQPRGELDGCLGAGFRLRHVDSQKIQERLAGIGQGEPLIGFNGAGEGILSPEILG